jgi:hypothetical protein
VLLNRLDDPAGLLARARVDRYYIPHNVV